MSPEEAVGIAYGDLHPVTHLPYEKERQEEEEMDIETNGKRNRNELINRNYKYNSFLKSFYFCII